MPGPEEFDEVAVGVEVPGLGLDDYELVAEVGEEPPEAVERTDEQVLRADGT